MRAIAVGNHQLVAFVDLGDLFGGDTDIGPLIVCGHGFTTAQKGVAAQCNDDTHIRLSFQNPAL